MRITRLQILQFLAVSRGFEIYSNLKGMLRVAPWHREAMLESGWHRPEGNTKHVATFMEKPKTQRKLSG